MQLELQRKQGHRHLFEDPASQAEVPFHRVRFSRDPELVFGVFDLFLEVQPVGCHPVQKPALQNLL